MKIKIHFARPRSMKLPFGSWLIRWVECKGIFKMLPYSHTAVEFEGNLVHIVFESVAPVSRVITAERWSEHYLPLETYEFDLEPRLVQPAFEWVFSMTDKKYSRLQCLIAGVADIFKPLRKWAGSETPNGSKYLICAEAVARFAQKFFGIKFDRSLDTIGLVDLNDIIKKSGAPVQ